MLFCCTCENNFCYRIAFAKVRWKLNWFLFDRFLFDFALSTGIFGINCWRKPYNKFHLSKELFLNNSNSSGHFTKWIPIGITLFVFMIIRLRLISVTKARFLWTADISAAIEIDFETQRSESKKSIISLSRWRIISIGKCKKNVVFYFFLWRWNSNWFLLHEMMRKTYNNQKCCGWKLFLIFYFYPQRLESIFISGWKVSSLFLVTNSMHKSFEISSDVK